MAKKKKAEEHENLERWLVSYSDFMTLLFATFVVLYALVQEDVDKFKYFVDSLRDAFDQTIMSGQDGINKDSSNSLLDGRDGATNPVMLEYVSQKYEQSSYESIENKINEMKEDGISASIDDRGLVIKFDKDAIKFATASAEINPSSYTALNRVAQIIKEKFSIHYIEVAGHSDSDRMPSNGKYPSNWELSSARASSVVRFLIKNHNFNPRIFTAVGYADTVPIVPNATDENKAKNRRVEIIVLKNKNRNLVKKDMDTILKEAKAMQRIYKGEAANSPSDAMKQLIGNDKQLLENVIDMSGEYKNEVKRLNNLNDDSYVIDGQKPSFME